MDIYKGPIVHIAKFSTIKILNFAIRARQGISRIPEVFVDVRFPFGTIVRFMSTNKRKRFCFKKLVPKF